MMFIGAAGSRGLFLLRGGAPRFGFVFLFFSQAGGRAESDKKCAVLKRAMTERHEICPKKG